jgi:two-component system OmpR family response regulator
MRILIVDDDPVTTLQFAHVLRGEGFEAVIASDGADALVRARERRPDAMLIDLHMRFMDGLELLTELRHDPALHDVPAAMVTGDYLLGDAEIARLAALGVRVKFKPLWLEDLLALVRELLDPERVDDAPAVASGVSPVLFAASE